MFSIGQRVVSVVWGYGVVIGVNGDIYEVRFNGFRRFVFRRYLRAFYD